MPNSRLRRCAPVPALACAAVVVTAPAAVAAPATVAPATVAAPAPSPSAKPPARMSAVGGARLARSGTQANPTAGAPALPKGISARSWIVSDAETGEVLAAHNAHWKLPPASTLKMLFADTVLGKLGKTAIYKVAPSDLAGMGRGSSQVGIKQNLTYSVHDLWLGVFLRSGNDAVQVLSVMNGGVTRTVREMNAKARELRADDTHVVSPDGYDMPNQTSSAYDLTLFARAGLQNADFRTYCSTVTADFPGDFKEDKSGKRTKTRESFQIQNTNRLLTGTGVPVYKGIAGVKNGYTSEAGNTFTGVAQRDGRTLLVTVLHPRPGHDEVYQEAAKLFDWGFAADGRVAPVGTLAAPLSRPGSAVPSTGSSHTDGGTRNPAAASAASGGGADTGGLLTALGIAVGTLAVVGGIGWFVTRRWPLPGSPGGGGRAAGRGDDDAG